KPGAVFAMLSSKSMPVPTFVENRYIGLLNKYLPAPFDSARTRLSLQRWQVLVAEGDAFAARIGAAEEALLRHHDAVQPARELLDLDVRSLRRERSGERLGAGHVLELGRPVAAAEM